MLELWWELGRIIPTSHTYRAVFNKSHPVVHYFETYKYHIQCQASEHAFRRSLKGDKQVVSFVCPSLANSHS